MSSIRILAVLLGFGALGAGCKGGVDAACHSVCDKQESCGDIDSVKANQCRKQCDANATVTQAELDTCLNESDILTASSQCLDRACSDYAKCLTTIPACKTNGSTGSGNPSSGSGVVTSSGSGVGPPGIIACDVHAGSDHICIEEPSNKPCPSSTTMVSACSTSNQLGTCTVTNGNVTIREHFYVGGNFTASSAEQSCVGAKGSWSPG